MQIGDAEEVLPVSATTPTAPPPAAATPEPDGSDGAPSRFAFVESILDNLSAWTVIAAAIGLLYLVWATIEILNRYVGHVPSVTP